MRLRQLPFIMFFLLCAGLTIAVWRVEDVVEAQQSNTFPDIKLEILQGEPVEQSGVVIYNFFASWCTPCVAEIPYLITLNRLTGAPVVGLAWDKDKHVIKNWLKRHGNPYSVVYDEHKGATARLLGLSGLPETFIVDADGNIMHRHSGPITSKDMQTLQSLIAMADS